MRSVWLLHNVRAGRSALIRRVDEAAEAMTRRGVRVRLVRDSDLSALRQATRDAVAAGADAVLVAGGDGTLGTLAGELAHTLVAFGALPAGTANVWAQQVGLPRTSLFEPHALSRAALELLDAPTCLTDLGRANGHWFLSWTGLGLDALAVQQFEAQRVRAQQVGGFIYNGLLAVGVAHNLRGLEARLEVTGPNGAQTVSGRYLMATVCNIALHGGGLFRFTRTFCLDDGMMDLWAWQGDNFGDALRLAGRVLRGAHAGDARVVRLTAERFDLYTAQPQAIHIDGEPQPTPMTHLSVQVVPRCLRVLSLPAAAPLYRHVSRS